MSEVRFEGFDEKILALYARGLSMRDIEARLAEIYGVNVGRDLISRVGDAIIDDVRAWQQRPLDDVYPVLLLDCLALKIREGGTVQRRACHLALGVTVDGERDVLAMWFHERSKFSMQVRAELRQRGVRDILICCVDGPKGDARRVAPNGRRAPAGADRRLGGGAVGARRRVSAVAGVRSVVWSVVKACAAPRATASAWLGQSAASSACSSSSRSAW